MCVPFFFKKSLLARPGRGRAGAGQHAARALASQPPRAPQHASVSMPGCTVWLEDCWAGRRERLRGRRPRRRPTEPAGRHAAICGVGTRGQRAAEAAEMSTAVGPLYPSPDAAMVLWAWTSLDAHLVINHAGPALACRHGRWKEANERAMVARRALAALAVPPPEAKAAQTTQGRA
jgi:hypothetical protein